MKKIILGLVIVLGLSFFVASGVDAIETWTNIPQYEEITTSPINTWVGNLSYGMRSEMIRELQQILSGDSYTHIYPEKLTTGYFGNLTLQAVKRFQTSQGLSQTGIVDQFTWNAILQPTIGKIGDIDNPTDTDTDRDVAPTYRPTSQAECNRQCVFNPLKGYDYGVCRMSCEAGEVNISTCRIPCPPGVACAAVEYYCCCGNKDGGDPGDCTDSDGGINKYVKGTTCQPSRWGGIIAQDNVVGSEEKPEMARLFCKTDECQVNTVMNIPIGSGSHNIAEGMLTEYYCENGKMMSKSIKCENGCKDGACLKEMSEYGKPYCNMEGSRSEGWYHQKANANDYRQELIRWDNCDGCLVVCKAIGSKSEGWYSSCDNKLIKYANCEEPTMTVLSPNGGERLVEGGGTYKITWELNKPAISSIDKIGIYLVDYSRDGIVCSSQGCEPWKRVIAWDLPAYPSEHLWSTSAPFWGTGLPPFLEEQYELMQDKSMKLGDKYKIRIGRMINPQMDFGFYDESDNYFSIVKMGDVSCRDENYPCSIEGIACCPGLKSSALYGDPNGDCSTIANCGTICIPCGNGVCDANEGICNCPEDCEAGACTKEEVPWHPHDPACCPGLKLVPSCIGVCPISAPSYCINCGDGVCKEHESLLNCPEDCKTTTPPVDVQPIITLIREAINKLNSAMSLLFRLSPYATSTPSDGGVSHTE